MPDIRLIQKPLRELVKVFFIPHPVDLGRFSVRILSKILREKMKDLELEFDKIEVYPGPQPRESGDLELYFKGKLVRRISVKTAVMGDIKVAFRKIWRDISRGLDGIILAFYTGKKKGAEEEDLKLILIYLPAGVIGYNSNQVLEEIQLKFEEKMLKENYEKLEPLAINEALMFEMIYRSIMAEEKIMEIGKLAEKAYEEAKKAGERAEKAYEEAKKAGERAEKAYEEAKKTRKLTEQIIDLLRSKRED
ncbi:MAG: hypothetical protein ACTSVW_01555 [Candidatus Njordarchaeales archaeon]